MHYHISKKAKEKLNIYSEIFLINGNCIEGFLIGELIGNKPIIADVLLIKFDKITIDNIYSIVLNTYGKKLLGPIFIGYKGFDSEWFSEDFRLNLIG